MSPAPAMRSHWTSMSPIEPAPNTTAVSPEAKEETLSIASERRPDGEVERVPILVLKPENREGRAPAVIVRSTVELGRNLGLHVIAEGVEDIATWNELDAVGCHAIQGYYVSRPVTPGGFQEWLDRQATPTSAATIWQIASKSRKRARKRKRTPSRAACLPIC